MEILILTREKNKKFYISPAYTPLTPVSSGGVARPSIRAFREAQAADQWASKKARDPGSNPGRSITLNLSVALPNNF